MSILIAKPAAAYSTSSVVYDCFPAVSIQAVVPQTTTVVADSVSCAGILGVKWFVHISNADGSRVQAYEALATHQSGSSPSMNTYSIVGDTFVVVSAVAISAGMLNLSVTNNDTEDLTISVTRLSVPINNSQLNVQDLVEIGSVRSYVATGATTPIDFVEVTTDVVAVKWIITVTNDAGSRQSSQVLMTISATTPSVTQYGWIGDLSLDHEMILTPIGTVGFQLSLHNVGPDNCRVQVTRIPIQRSEGISHCGSNTRGLSLWLPTIVTIDPSDTLPVDTIDLTSHTGTKWMAVVKSGAQTMACEIVTTTPTVSSATVLAYGFIGVSIPIEFSTSIAGDLILSAHNTGLTSVTVYLLRVPVAA